MLPESVYKSVTEHAQHKTSDFFALLCAFCVDVLPSMGLGNRGLRLDDGPFQMAPPGKGGREEAGEGRRQIAIAIRQPRFLDETVREGHDLRLQAVPLPLEICHVPPLIVEATAVELDQGLKALHGSPAGPPTRGPRMRSRSA